MSDTPPPVREIDLVLQGLWALSLPHPGLADLEEELRHDYATLPLERLGFDSLARMEFCIHLELDHGVVITPETLITLHSVSALIELIRAQLD